MSCEQDKDEAFWLSRDSREASSFFAIKAVCHSPRFIHAILWLLCEIHLLARCHSQRFILSVCSAVFIENVHRTVIIAMMPVQGAARPFP